MRPERTVTLAGGGLGVKLSIFSPPNRRSGVRGDITRPLVLQMQMQISVDGFVAGPT